MEISVKNLYVDIGALSVKVPSGHLTVGTHNLLLSKLTGTESILVGHVLDYPSF